MLARITALYIELVFRRPLLVIALVLITAAGFGYYGQYFRLDASADSLMLEGDKDLEYSREINAIYGISESVIIAYTPLNAPLFSRPTLERMESLRQELLKIDRVSGVDSILNVPIFLDTPLTGISEDYLTLNDAEIDLEVAREELVNSPVFRNAVVSPDGETAGTKGEYGTEAKASSCAMKFATNPSARIVGNPKVKEITSTSNNSPNNLTRG